MTNDWLVANLNNPDFTVSDFQNIADMSTANTQMLSKDKYLKSDFIKNNDAFKDDNGQFSQRKFDDYYNQQLNRFQDFRTNNTPDGLEYDVFDVRRTPSSKVKKDNLSISKSLYNPDRQQIGIEGVNIWSDPELSKAEIAQSQQVFNTETGKFENYTPHDLALFNGKSDFGLSWLKSLFSDPLVLATYDKDEIDNQGRKHYKGDYKLNANGTYYYETLNGRSPIGKEVLSSLDNLTVEGTKVNKYDFFDSDDIEKSVTGTIAKNVAQLVPIFIGGPVATAYSTLIISKEMAKSIPMLYNMASSLVGGGDSPAWLNTIAAMGDKFSSNTSQYAKQHTFSFENFGNLVSDVALQWGQQKTIAQAFNKMRESENLVTDAYKNAEALYLSKAIQPEWMAQAGNPAKWMESALGKACIKKFVPEAEKAMVAQTQLGRDASLAYMAIISNSDVYNDAIQNGASRQEAAAVALGSTLGMFAVDKYAHLGEIFFDDATEDSVKAARQVLKKELSGDKGLQEVMTKGIINNPEVINNGAKRYLTIINNTANKVKDLFNNFNEDLKYHTLGFFGKAVGEGTEEVAEELVTDTAKSIYELAGYLGANTSTKDIGAWDNAFDRYTMSFLGGAVGGGVFYTKEAFQNPNMRANKQDQEMAALIRNGHAKELRDQVEYLRKNGKLGSTNLSGTKYSETVDDKGNITGRVWLTAENASDSQNEIIAKHLNNKITTLEAVINNNELNLSDDQLFQNMVLQEARYQAYQENAAITGYYDQFNDVFTEISDAQLDYNKASKTVDGTVNGEIIPNDNYLHGLTPEQQATRTENLEKLKQKLEAAREKKNQFLSGDVSIDYIRKLNFAMDKALHSQFMDIDAEQLWNQMFPGKKKKDASAEELLQYNEKLDAQQSFTTKEQLTQSWNRFKSIEDTLKPTLHNLGTESKDYLKYFEQWQQLTQQLGEIKRQVKGWDDKLDSESDDDFKNRDIKLQLETGEESDEEFIARKNNRIKILNAYNEAQDAKWVQEVETLLSKINYQVDPITLQQLNRVIPLRIKDIIRYTTTKYPELDNALTLINTDLSNIDEVKQKLRDVQNIKTKESLQDSLKELREGKFIDVDGNKTILPEFDEQATFSDLVDNEQRQNIIDFLNEVLSPESANKVIELLDRLEPYVEEDTSIQDFINNGIINDVDNELNNGPIFDAAISDILNNPIVKLRQKLQSSVKNPILEITKELVGKVLNGKKQEDVAKVLNIIQHNYDNIDSVEDLELDAAQLQTLTMTRDALQLVATYIYVASSEPTSENAIGHNKVINQYAKNHSDKILNFEELPEIDTNYTALFQQSIGQFLNTINNWIQLSNENAINKRKLFSKTDKALVRSFTGFWKNNNFKVNINGHSYDLLEGYKEVNNPNVNLYNYEHLFYQNLQKLLTTEKIGIKEFLQQSKLLDNNINYNNLEQQDISRLSPQLQYETLTSYDKLVYLATIMSLNSSDFYSFIKTEVNNNEGQAPIASQEYGIRVGIAHFSDVYKTIMGYAFDQSGSTMYNASNTTIITGDAGAGKTSVVAKGIIHFFGKDTKVVCAGPTLEQAHGLFNSIGQGKELEVRDILKQILGSQYAEIENDLNISLKDDALTKESKYYHMYTKNGITTAVIHPENISLGKLEDSPKVLVIDEATHIPAVYVQILNEYMKQNGGELILVGDKKQRSYDNKYNGMANITVGDMFATRTPELNVSLRDNNIQKSTNLQQVRSILSSALDNFVNLSTEDWKNYVPNLKAFISKIQFHYFNGDQLTGELITSTLNDDIISKLTGSIGFIGKSDSAYYKQLLDAGLKPKLMSMEEMQGQEFDYVVIDQPLTLGTGYKQVEFLQDLYTLMSRGRTASIFIDNGLSSIIKPSTQDDYTAKAPSLTDKINGESIIDQLRNDKLSNLSQYDLTDATPPASETTTAEADTKNEVSPTDFKDPETIVNPKQEEIDNALNDEANPDTENTPYELIDDDFTVLAYSNISYLGVNVVEKYKQKSSKNGKTYTGNLWNIEQGNVRRNISALTDDKSIFWYKDKMNMQKLLNDVKSILIYQHDFNETDSYGNYVVPEAIRSRFKYEDWVNGVFKVEFRKTDGEVKAIGNSTSKVGMKYGGAEFIAEIVFEVKDKNGNTCIFDLASINNPDTFAKKKEVIEANLKKRIDKATNPEYKAKLQKTLDGLGTSLTAYTNLFDSWVEQYKRYGKFSLNVSDAIQYKGLTSFVRRTGPDLRLDGFVDPNNVDKPSTKNFKTLNPGYVISDVYTYADENPDLMKIDPSIKGRAVVFVSGDTLLKQSDLINIYIQQKLHPDKNKPTVRMIKLNNYGLSFGQLYDDKLLGKIQKDNITSLPFRANYHGIQMFVSMWNWRAALDNFTKALNQWKADNGYTDEAKVEAIIKAEHDIFENPNNKDTILRNKGLTQADLDNLNKFNLEICKEIPIFRLGYSTKKDFHIQRFNVKGSSAYKGKDEANLIVITPQKALQFYKILDKIMTAIVPSKWGIPSLNVQLKKIDGSEWKNDEYIDIKDAKHQRTLSGLFKQDLAIEDEDGVSLVYKDGNQWSLIPKLLDKFVRNIAWYQDNPKELKSDYSESVHIKVDKGKDTEYTVTMQFGDLIADKIVLDSVSNGGKFDTTVYDMFNLMFHGTTDDIHRVSTKENPLIQADDARFPRGFLINPDITRKRSTNSTDIAISYNGEVFFYPIETPGEFFTVDVDMRNLGIGLSLSRLLKSKQDQEKTVLINPLLPTNESGNVPANEPTNQQPKLIQELIEDHNIDKDERIEDIVDIINGRLKANLANSLSSSQNPKDVIVTYTINTNGDDVIPTTLNDLVKTQLGIDDFSVDVIQNNDKLYINIKADNKTYILNPDNFTIQLESADNVLSINQPYGNSTVIDSLLNLFYQDETKQALEQQYQTFSEQNLNDFIKELKELKGLKTEEEIEQKVQNINSLKYLLLLKYLKSVDENLYNKLFVKCQ